MKIDEKICCDILMFVFKLTHEGIPRWVLPLPKVGEQQQRLTRQVNNFVVPRTRTKIAEKSLKVRCPRLWNDLSSNIKDIDRQSLFKKEIRQFHLANMYILFYFFLLLN